MSGLPVLHVEIINSSQGISVPTIIGLIVSLISLGLSIYNAVDARLSKRPKLTIMPYSDRNLYFEKPCAWQYDPDKRNAMLLGLQISNLSNRSVSVSEISIQETDFIAAPYTPAEFRKINSLSLIHI